MPLPTPWVQVPIFASLVYNDAAGTPVTGAIYFAAKQIVVVNNGDHPITTVIPEPIKAVLVDGMLPAGFTLPSTDDPHLNYTTWAYEVSGAFPGAAPPYWIFVPYDTPPPGLDLATVSPVVPPPQLVTTQGLSAYQVALANGFVGTPDEWLASLVGPPGPSGSQTINLTAATALDAPRVVAVNAQGTVHYPDLSVPSDVASIVGVTTQAVQAGDPVAILCLGQITENLWTWGTGAIFCSQTGGQLSQTPAASAYVPVAKALGPTSLFVSIQPSTLRA